MVQTEVARLLKTMIITQEEVQRSGQAAIEDGGEIFVPLVLVQVGFKMVCSAHYQALLRIVLLAWSPTDIGLTGLGGCGVEAPDVSSISAEIITLLRSIEILLEIRGTSLNTYAQV